MRALRLRILLPVFGILGMFLFSILTGTESLDAIHPQTDRWQTIEGEWREPSQSEKLANVLGMIKIRNVLKMSFKN